MPSDILCTFVNLWHGLKLYVRVCRAGDVESVGRSPGGVEVTNWGGDASLEGSGTGFYKEKG